MPFSANVTLIYHDNSRRINLRTHTKHLYLVFQERWCGQAFSQSIRHHKVCCTWSQLNKFALHQLSDKMLACVNVTRTFTIDRIVSHDYYCPRIFIQLCRAILLESEVRQNAAQVNNLLASFTGGTPLRFSSAERNTLLLGRFP